MEVAAQIGQLLNETLSSDCGSVRTASEALDRFSQLPDFPYYLLSISAGNYELYSNFALFRADCFLFFPLGNVKK